MRAAAGVIQLRAHERAVWRCQVSSVNTSYCYTPQGFATPGGGMGGQSQALLQTPLVVNTPPPMGGSNVFGCCVRIQKGIIKVETL